MTHKFQGGGSRGEIFHGMGEEMGHPCALPPFKASTVYKLQDEIIRG